MTSHNLFFEWKISMRFIRMNGLVNTKYNQKDSEKTTNQNAMILNLCFWHKFITKNASIHVKKKWRNDPNNNNGFISVHIGSTTYNLRIRNVNIFFCFNRTISWIERCECSRSGNLCYQNIAKRKKESKIPFLLKDTVLNFYYDNWVQDSCQMCNLLTGSIKIGKLHKLLLSLLYSSIYRIKIFKSEVKMWDTITNYAVYIGIQSLKWKIQDWYSSIV